MCIRICVCGCRPPQGTAGAPGRCRCGPFSSHTRAHTHACSGAGECYGSLTVSGAEAVQAAAMGTFTKVANLTQGYRPVYKRVTAAPTAPPVLYLFYWPSTSEWLIGSNYTSTSNISVQSAGIAALCPEQVPEIGWEVYNGSAWVSMYPIQFVRTGDTPAAAPLFAA